jgi:hypothetical protein
MMRAKSSSGAALPSLPITRLAAPMPAMWARMRAGPCAAAACSMAACRLAPSVMSHAQATPLDVRGHALGVGQVDVEHGDLGAQAGEFAGGGLAEARSAAGDEGGLSLNVHLEDSG